MRRGTTQSSAKAKSTPMMSIRIFSETLGVQNITKQSWGEGRGGREVRGRHRRAKRGSEALPDLGATRGQQCAGAAYGPRASSPGGQADGLLGTGGTVVLGPSGHPALVPSCSERGQSRPSRRLAHQSSCHHVLCCPRQHGPQGICHPKGSGAEGAAAEGMTGPELSPRLDCTARRLRQLTGGWLTKRILSALTKY